MRWTTSALASALGVLCMCATAPAAELAGRTGNVAWEFVDAIQSRLVDEQATRWDFSVTLKLTAPGSISIERIESGARGRAAQSYGVSVRLAEGETVRFFHWEQAPLGESKREVFRRYVGQDDKGNAVAIEARGLLDASVGARQPPPPSARITPPAGGAPLPSDLRVIPADAKAPAAWAGFSGVWTGSWASGRAHVLVVEEVQPREGVVVYSVGPIGDRQGLWFRRKVRARDDRLVVDLAHDERITYTRNPDGSLTGSWIHNDGRSGRVTVTRQAAVARPAGGDATPTRAARLASEALTALADGQYADALPRAQEALSLREAALGPSHPDVAASLTTLAEVYRAQGKLDDAERLHRRALGIRESLGRDSLESAWSLNYLAVINNARGNYREAESLLTRALAAVDRSKPSGTVASNRVKADILENSAKVYRALGRLADADAAAAKAAILWASQ